MLSMMLKKWHTVENMPLIFHFKLSGGRDLVWTAFHEALMRPDSQIIPFLQDPKRDHEGQTD